MKVGDPGQETPFGVRFGVLVPLDVLNLLPNNLIAKRIEFISYLLR